MPGEIVGPFVRPHEPLRHAKSPRFSGVGHAAFDITHGIKVFVELAAVAAAQAGLQIAGVVGHEIQQAPLLLAMDRFGIVRRRRRAE